MPENVPVLEVQVVTKDVEKLKPHQRLYVQQLSALSTASEMLQKQDYEEIAQYSRAVGAPTIAEIIEQLGEHLAPGTVRLVIPVPEHHFSTAEIADICGVSTQMVRRACESGQLKATRGNQRSWLIPDSELSNPICVRWIENKQSAGQRIKRSRDVLSRNTAFMEGLLSIEREREKNTQDD